MSAHRDTFASALARAEFSHIERIVQDSTPMLVAYRHDPASSAGKGYLASMPEHDVVLG